MKGTFFNKPLEWNIETTEESWQQGSSVRGTIKVKNHGTETIELPTPGVALAYADIKKVHARTEGVFKPEVSLVMKTSSLAPGESAEESFSVTLPENCPVSDKKSSFYLTYGRQFTETNLQLKVEPKAIFTKLIGLLDTFYRFKVKEYKGTKKGVEYKLIPPTSREMANLDSLGLTLMMNGEDLRLDFDFQVKKLDTAGPTNKINKASVKVQRTLTPKEYSLGKDMINQDQLLKMFESALSEVKLNNVF